MSDKNIEANLVFIKVNYGNIPSCIKCLEASGTYIAEIICRVYSLYSLKNSILNIQIIKE